ncbi:SDR family oxidoreductase [Noviherbaspirillum saxi]|uniref:SDR family oxidoreductase n=1 Tax=Noviherbaspirillum saxi TaxID=2320863 RepID=A0A3A3FFM8_9BURK|nr:SDR family oxidoreductase [Noviherbaspirillum saxi]
MQRPAIGFPSIQTRLKKVHAAPEKTTDLFNFTRTLVGEWGRYGITVNALAPGFFPCKMTKDTLEKMGEDDIARRTPLQRIGDDEDLKGAALLFASYADKHVTGQVLAIDGGISAVN